MGHIERNSSVLRAPLNRFPRKAPRTSRRAGPAVIPESARSRTHRQAHRAAGWGIPSGAARRPHGRSHTSRARAPTPRAPCGISHTAGPRRWCARHPRLPARPPWRSLFPTRPSRTRTRRGALGRFEAQACPTEQRAVLAGLHEIRTRRPLLPLGVAELKKRACGAHGLMPRPAEKTRHVCVGGVTVEDGFRVLTARPPQDEAFGLNSFWCHGITSRRHRPTRRNRRTTNREP